MDSIRFHAQHHPKDPAISDLRSETVWSYEALDKLVAGCVSLLLERGVVAEDRVGCLSKNTTEVVALHFACVRIGALFVPMNWRLADSELQRLTADCSPKVVFVEDMHRDVGASQIDIDTLISRCDLLEPVWLDDPAKDLASLMLYTSGTTGKPKGVMLTERNLTEVAINSTMLMEVNRHSTFLCESPMFHIIGMVTSIRPPLLHGGKIVISDGFDPERTVQRLGDPSIGITHYFCVPQMATALRNAEGFSPAALGGLKALLTGGAPHPAQQIQEWLSDGIAVVDGYGSSEAGTVFGMPIDMSLIEKKAGSVGVPTPRIEARIVDEQGNVLRANMPGELQLRGDNIAAGYWIDGEISNEIVTSDGWFYTGDILLQDEDGFYFVTDRKKDMYISGGENVYPAEVEAALLDFPGLGGFAIAGVPDEQWGEVGCLFYVGESGQLDFEKVQAFLEDKIAKYKIPKRSLQIDVIPCTGVGKVQKHRLRELYQEIGG